MRFREFCAAVCALWAVHAGVAKAAEDTAASSYEQKIIAQQRPPCDLAAWRALVADAAFPKASSPIRSLALTNLAYCGDPDSKAILRRATSEPGAIPPAWNIRFITAAQAGDREEALQTLEEAAARKAPQAFAFTSEEILFKFSQSLKQDPSSERRFLVAIDQLNWKPPVNFDTADIYWIRLTDIYLAEGKLDDARRVSRKAETPYAVSRFRLADRYAPIRVGRQLDVNAAAEQRLTIDQYYLSQSPRNGLGLTTVSRDLRRLGRAQDALKLLDDALAKPGPLLNGRREVRNWVLNERSAALYDLGRFDEAMQAMRDASVLSEQGGANASQAINLAIMLNELGRHAEAIETLETLQAADFSSPFGRMFVAAAKACANSAMGKTADASKGFAYTAEHQQDNLGARQQALLCMGDLNSVAARYIADLADPSKSAQALIELSQFRHAARGPFEMEIDRRMDLVRGRADVQAAIAKVGHTEPFDLIASAAEGAAF